MLTYITYEQLAHDVRLLIKQLPRSVILDLVGVLGIPRSGMLPATMIAAHLHLPVIDCYSFVRFSCRFTIPGKRLNSSPEGKTLLVVDDSIYAGTAMTTAIDVLESYGSSNEYLSAAIYRCPEKKAAVDFYAREVAKPRYFEWNLMQHQNMPEFMLDYDGVLCYDPPWSGIEDAEYIRSLVGAVPLHLPAYSVGNICTMRLEKHRLISENWLNRHNVTFGTLSMANVASAEERRKTMNYGEWKGQQYRDSDSKLFIESDGAQAPIINYVAKKPVICLTTGKVHQDENSTSDTLPQ